MSSSVPLAAPAHEPAPLFHPVEGRADCLGCHRTGKVAARPLPESHATYPGGCLGCHPRAAGSAVALYGVSSGAGLLFVLGLVVVLLRARCWVGPGRGPRGAGTMTGVGARLEGRWAARSRQLAAYGLLQRKVAGGGWPGVAHVALVAGFTALLLGSATLQVDVHALAPRGHGLGRGAAYHALQVALDVAGLLLVMGAAALLARRLAGPPGAAPRGGARIGLLAALLVLALSGFALQGLRASLDPGATASATALARLTGRALLATGLDGGARAALYEATWWAHVALVAGLLVWAPFSPLLHAVTATVHTALGSPRPVGALEAPFDLREVIASGKFNLRVGIRTAGDLGARERLGLLACAQCARCDAVCPAHASGTPLTPSALMRKLRAATTRSCRRSAGDEPLLGGPIAEDEIWSCLMCGACAEACPALLAPLGHVVGLRRHVASTGRLNGQRAEALANLARAGNPYGLPLAARGDVASELGAPADTGADTVYWLGCAATYDARVRKVARAMVRLMRRAGLRFAVLGADERCCGDPARRLGEEGRFQELALANIEALARRGARRVVTHCAHCFNALAHEYPALGGRFEVVHHATLLRELLASGALVPRVPLGAPVALHDACYLGRFNRMFEAPRDVVRAIPEARLVELPRRREAAACCGGGGGSYWFDVPRKERPGVARVREVLGAGARHLAVECPFCLRMLEDAVTAAAPGEALVVLDVAELLAGSLALESGPQDEKEGGR